MIQFTTTLLKFATQGEKTGWTYIEIPAETAQQIKPGIKKSFRVKGKLDNHAIASVALLPMGGGKFIMPVNAGMRKGIGKKQGHSIFVQLEEDNSPLLLNADLMECLADDAEAMKFFQSLSNSHQRYFSKWIDSAKTDDTKAKRISQVINALAKRLNFGEMLRSQKRI